MGEEIGKGSLKRKANEWKKRGNWKIWEEHKNADSIKALSPSCLKTNLQKVDVLLMVTQNVRDGAQFSSPELNTNCFKIAFQDFGRSLSVTHEKGHRRTLLRISHGDHKISYKSRIRYNSALWLIIPIFSSAYSSPTFSQSCYFFFLTDAAQIWWQLDPCIKKSQV